MSTDGSPNRVDVGHEMRYWLGLVCRELREAHGIRVREVAYYADVDPKTIERFEDGETLKHVDAKLTAYTYALGRKDPRDLWTRAVKEWKARGEAPEFWLAEDPTRQPPPPLRVADEARRKAEPKLLKTRQREASRARADQGRRQAGKRE